ncbi:MAG TPA: hypothetical protein PKI20_21130 [Verrucomicrobiota bacterium]|nr:hypothetical protein [Verrucomicrobiota bacterium]
MSVEFGARGGYLSCMRRLCMGLLAAVWLATAVCAQAATGRVIKVLPQFLDLKGRNSLTPSLQERDTYQAYLRDHTNECSGMRFNVQWKTKGQPAAPLKLRLEVRGIARGDFPRQLTLESPVKRRGWFSQWTWFALVGREYEDFGSITAWRVTLWEGDQLLGEQRSYLW